jgi:hypothetical protein
MNKLFEIEDSGFYQLYDTNLSAAQDLFIFCRMCRQSFPLKVKAEPRARVRCACGHKSPLSDFDVFDDPERLEQFSSFYRRIVSAVKNVLTEAGIPTPPSGRYVPYREGHVEDESDIRESYVAVDSDEQSSVSPYAERISELKDYLEAARGDVIDVHEVLSKIIALSYSRRGSDEEARALCHKCCRADLTLAPRVVRESKRRRSEGESPRLSFSSFKHLSIMLEEEGRLKSAYRVCQKAKQLGLKRYEPRMKRLATAIKHAKAAKSKAKRATKGGS